MCVCSLSAAGEGGWERRGAQTLQLGSHGLEPALCPSPKSMVWQVPVGEGSVRWDQTEGWVQHPQSRT